MLNDPQDFASRIYSSVKSSLSISPDAPVEEDDAEEAEAEDAGPVPEEPEPEASSLKDEL